MNNTIELLESRKAVALSAIFMAASIYGMWSGQEAWESAAWGSVLLSGIPIAWGAAERLIIDRQISSGLLITMAIIASIAVDELFAAGEIAWIMALGEQLEHGAVARAKRGLERLISLSPQQGRLLEGGKERMVAAEALKPGDVIRIKPGENIPADGIIRSGCAAVDQSALTGESEPIERREGDVLYAGSISSDGSVDMEVTRSSADSSLARLIRLVREAGERRAPIQREADRWAAWLVPTSLLIALGGYVVLRLLGYEGAETLVRAVTTLVVFCPCALVLATPTGMMAAIGQAAKHGVMIKSGEALEALAQVTAFAFDKTGTLTQGRFRLAEIHAFGLSEEELLRYAAALESRSGHPIAKAFASVDKDEEVTQFRALPGQGVEGVIRGRSLLCAHEKAVRAECISLSREQEELLDSLREQGLSTILLADRREGRLMGIMALEDSVRAEAGDVLRQMSPLRTLMLTGDHARAAARLMKQLPLNEARAELLPAQKALAIEELRAEGGVVAMVGDGVNDAPALKQADVGIAMSHLGADIATETADISLLHDDLSSLPYLLRLSRATLHNIRFNITAALLINLVAVGMGLAGLLGPTLGALVHNAGSVIVILNAALLYDRKI